MQQRSNRPLGFVLPELPGIGRDADFHRQRMFAEVLRFRELVQNLERLLSRNHHREFQNWNLGRKN
jgi:hypothetical protein